jgi:hypothetical protein
LNWLTRNFFGPTYVVTSTFAYSPASQIVGSTRSNEDLAMAASDREAVRRIQSLSA